MPFRTLLGLLTSYLPIVSKYTIRAKVPLRDFVKRKISYIRYKTTCTSFVKRENCSIRFISACTNFGRREN